ncbi:Hsp20/alpha crystallin family protein [Pelagicoccus mobilis]|uniref:Hsp20/alpha crystallin family protein n=1 Tax=Pelagicoccus mobilis TaxID=415221 RepID=A0A934RVI4_9BACT|nr:Hsp20/alpha crystallin family protein [Pelagicoccus mobilis]MBK1878470.1 Hsp20/alpha crystallin family protein [Pelagicoccus mobilis]
MTTLNVTKNTKTECPTACQAEAGDAKRVRNVRPQYRVRELDTEFVVTVDVPGVAKEAVDVSLVDGVLEISGTRSWAQRGDWKPLAGVSEDDVVYRLRLAIGDEVDGEKISADLNAGVLKLTLAKAEDKKPRRIAVN